MSAVLDPEFDETCDDDRSVSVHRLDWQGIVIEVRYEAHYLGLPDLAHLDITSVSPAYAPLPITETGYRSHFLDELDVDEAGGPSDFVLRWLESQASHSSWIEREEAARQYTLF